MNAFTQMIVLTCGECEDAVKFITFHPNSMSLLILASTAAKRSPKSQISTIIGEYTPASDRSYASSRTAVDHSHKSPILIVT